MTGGREVGAGGRPGVVVGLRDVTAGMRGLVGGKAAGLGELIRAGERVPDGFCVTTEALELPRGEILRAYEGLGGGAVAVRSSATVEDAPDASYAGMFDTVLDVHGIDDVLAAIEQCRASAGNARAAAYGVGSERDNGRAAAHTIGSEGGGARAAAHGDGRGSDSGQAVAFGAGHEGGEAPEAGRVGGSGGLAMAVVVQRMVEAATGGVLFTANPLTGNRAEMLVESAAGSGVAVVDGHVDVERRLVGRDEPLWAVGERLQALFEAPQDVEWAVDKGGELWILQSRAITTLFPAPPVVEGAPRVYLEFGHVQGMLQPVTPMGMDTLKALVTAMLVPLGLRVEITDIGGRLYGDMSDLVRDPVARKRLISLMAVDFGPRAQAVMRHVLDDPRFAPGARRKRAKAALPPVGRAVRGVLGALVNPDKARARLEREIERIRKSAEDDGRERTTAERLALVREHDQGDGADAIVWPIVAGMLAGALPPRLLGDVARPGEVHAVLAGMPHNVTIEMDLALWRVAQGATSADDADLTEFLRAYGHRAAAEVDLGVPRWSEDPTPVRAALANLMRVTDPAQAPDVRFARAAAQAEATLRDLAVRAKRRRPVRGSLAVFLLKRARRLAGLRESGKFAGLFRLAEMRRHLLAAGADLVAEGRLVRPDDIMFVTLDEVSKNKELRELVAGRRVWHERESRRRSVPVGLFSDGTDIEAVIPGPRVEGALRGVGASAGKATGPVRVVTDPATARIEPGEVLVTATTDPGWTPLFLTAAALVTETGAVMAHGPTVAREYGIPAVICVRGATRHLRTGQIVSVDAAAGTVTVLEES